VYKATSIAHLESGITLVSFHGFNGTFQGRRVEDLIEHVDSVRNRLENAGPVVWAGDFNTFTEDHVTALEEYMRKSGFSMDISVPYNFMRTLDFVFTRECKAVMIESGNYGSDHPFVLFDVYY
jgi:endonuclease/exonuclease/phosphatase (EEP) superfamily protein YafD